MSKVGVICDGCGTAAPGGPFPLGWLRLHLFGRPGADPVQIKIGYVDVCEQRCVAKALKDYWQRVAVPGSDVDP